MYKFRNQSGSKLDASLGLLANVPSSILNKIFYNFNLNNENRNVEIIIMYRNTPDEVKSSINSINGTFQDLGYNFGIVNIPLTRLIDLAQNKNIQYLELPKSLYESDQVNNRASCVPETINQYKVSGKDVLIGFIDSGIDYTHPAFLNYDGTTRIKYIYDISNGEKVYDENIINRAIKSNNPYDIVPVVDLTGHGTHVVGDACGGGNIPEEYKGVATEASIIMVKGSRGRWVLSSQIIKGVNFLIEKSKELDMPLTINISLSTNDGSHNGSSLLEQYIQTVANLERVSIVVAAGNEGNSAHHTSDTLDYSTTKSFNVSEDESTIVINIYKSLLPDISINIIGATGENSGIINISEGYFQGNIGRDRYDIYVSGPKPFELQGEIQIIISSISDNYIVGGIWNIVITPLNNYSGKYEMWLPISEGLNVQTKFLQPVNYDTIGIPATVNNIISVGSYNSLTNTLSPFSGVGNNNGKYAVKPDISAPGENVFGPSVGGGYERKTGTSMAAPQVSGICALLMEWGIVRKKDLYLFGQRLKYYLIKGANRKRTDVSYPNVFWGYGTVCAYNSITLVENTINSILAQRKFENEMSYIDFEYAKNNIFNKIYNEFKVGRLFIRIVY